MTNLTTQTDDGKHEDSSHTSQSPGMLVLTGNSPTKIYVNAKPHNNPTTAGFSTERHGTFFTDGISWQSDGEFGMFVTFHFLHGVSGVDCDGLPYSPVTAPTQMLAILPAAPVSYGFTVTFSNGVRHDPEIVVTPPSLPDPNS